MPGESDGDFDEYGSASSSDVSAADGSLPAFSTSRAASAAEFRPSSRVTPNQVSVAVQVVVDLHGGAA